MSFPKLTLTAMYGVLPKSRAGEPLSAKERKIAEQSELQKLQRLHDELDSAVTDAYGWPVDLGEQEVLRRLLELNSQCIEKGKSDQASFLLRPELQQKEPQIPVIKQLDENKSKGILPLATMYDVPKKSRAEEMFSATECNIADQAGLQGLHDKLDAAVADASV